MNNDLLEKGFYAPKGGNGSTYNYDLTPFIENFSFYDYIDYAESHKDQIEDYGAFLVITDRQYVLGYNSGFGTGTHLSSFARTVKDIKGGGLINGIQEAMNLNIECEDNYLTAVIVYEQTRKDINSKPIYMGHISFDLTRPVSEKEYLSFRQFYEDNNEELNYVKRKFKGKFAITCSYIDSNKNRRVVEVNSLDQIDEYLKRHIDYNKIVPEDKVIIGKETQSKGLK